MTKNNKNITKYITGNEYYSAYRFIFIITTFLMSIACLLSSRLTLGTLLLIPTVSYLALNTYIGVINIVNYLDRETY